MDTGDLNLPAYKYQLEQVRKNFLNRELRKIVCSIFV